MKADILIKGGQVIDTARNLNEVCDVAIKGNKILEVGQSLEMEADIKVNAKGCIVSPGIIDYHLHMYVDGTEPGVDPDIALLPSGVTSAVEGGSASVASYELFRRAIMINSKVRIKSYINISSGGMVTHKFSENIDPKYYEGERLIELFNKYPDELLGLKVRLSKGIIGNKDEESLRETIKIADEIGCPVVVHTTNPSIDTESLSSMMRPGDVFCHCFHGTGDTIIGTDGKVKNGIKKARERGVIFDSCNGRFNFSFTTAKAAIADGFLPDIISTDLNVMIMYKHPVISMPYLMSKYINMGMDIVDVFKACTQTPAALMSMEGAIGTLAPGAFADLAIFKLVDHESVFYDVYNDSLRGNKLLVPQMTIKDGIIMFRQVTFSEEIR